MSSKVCVQYFLSLLAKSGCSNISAIFCFTTSKYLYSVSNSVEAKLSTFKLLGDKLLLRK